MADFNNHNDGLGHMLGHSLILFIQHDVNLNNYSTNSAELLFVQRLFA